MAESQERMAQRFEALFTKDEERARSGIQGIENLAYHEAQEAAAAYDYVQESLTDVITQARDLRARIHSGTVPEKDARKLLRSNAPLLIISATRSGVSLAGSPFASTISASTSSTSASGRSSTRSSMAGSSPTRVSGSPREAGRW